MDNMDNIPASQIIDVPPRGTLVAQPHVSPPVSPAPSSPLSRSLTPSPADRDSDVEHKDGEIKEQHVDDADIDASPSAPDVGSLLPHSYQSWPHLFTYVPNKARDFWILACVRVLTNLRAVYNEYGIGPEVDKVILKFLLLPRLLLRRVAGQAHADKKLARSLIAFLQNQAEPQEQQSDDSTKDTRSDAARRVSAATRKVKQGHVRKAVDALIQPGMLEITIETLEQLQSLHPNASDPLSPDDIEFAATQAKQWLSSGDISKRSERFYDNGSAPGPSGWTGAMLRPLLVNDICRSGLALIFSLLMNGDLRDPAVRETLRAARLIPVPKGTPPSTAVRPIAVGELFARVSCVFAMSGVKLAVVFNDGIQLGQGIRSGVERAVLTVQALLDRHITIPDIIVISTDVRNAFNSVARSRVMTALRSNTQTEHLCRLFEWSHDGASPLLVYKDRALLQTIASQEGVQQGHVLGSLGYNMSIHPDYVAVQAEHKDQDVRLVAIHDDLTIVGPAQAAFAAFDMFATRLSVRGDLQLRPDKCRVLMQLSSVTSLHRLSSAWFAHVTSIGCDNCCLFDNMDA